MAFFAFPLILPSLLSCSFAQGVMAPWTGLTTQMVKCSCFNPITPKGGNTTSTGKCLFMKDLPVLPFKLETPSQQDAFPGRSHPQTCPGPPNELMESSQKSMVSERYQICKANFKRLLGSGLERFPAVKVPPLSGWLSRVTRGQRISFDLMAVLTLDSSGVPH